MKERLSLIDTDKLELIFKKYKINPKKYSRYITALTHSSYKNEHQSVDDYERFEFLGDSAISWIISNFLFDEKDLNEGDMSNMRSKIVCTKTLARASEMLGLGELAILGNGMKIIPITDKVLEDLFEAFIGAVCKDAGIKKAKDILDDTLIKMYKTNEFATSKPYKCLVQELLGRSEVREIKYVQMNAKEDIPRKVKLTFCGVDYAEGVGNTLKEAEENAAYNCYKKYANQENNLEENKKKN